MNYPEFLKQIIDSGIEAVKEDYKNRDNDDYLKGSIAGFEACRDKLPQELVGIYEIANKKAYDEQFFEHDLNDLGIKRERGYWWYRCYVLEVEWVINVVSAMLVNNGSPSLMSHLPTARGMMRAAEILGIKEVEIKQ